MISKDTLDQWKQWARRDDWHLYFVGSDIRQMIGEVERLQCAISQSADRSERHSLATGSGRGAARA